MKLYAILKDIFDDFVENLRENRGFKLDNMTYLLANAALLILTFLVIMWFGLFLWNQGVQPVFPGVVAKIPDYYSLFKFVAALMVFA
jgi:hypothetical protein